MGSDNLLPAWGLGMFSVAGCQPFAGLMVNGQVLALDALSDALHDQPGGRLLGTDTLVHCLEFWQHNSPLLAAMANRVLTSGWGALPSSATPVALSFLHVHAPIPQPRQFFCSGANYRQHVMDLVVDQRRDIEWVSLWQHLSEGDMLHHLGLTLARVGVSFAIAMLLGVVIGILMGAFRRVNQGADALLVIALNVPALVTILLCYIWFGLTEAAAVTAVAINKIPTVVVMVREGARIIDRELMDVARVYRVSPLRCFFKVYLPQLYPFIMAAARSGLSLIWKIVLVVELLGRSDGVGFQLGTFFHFFDITSILAYTLAFAAVILLIEALIMRPLDQYIARGGYGQS